LRDICCAELRIVVKDQALNRWVGVATLDWTAPGLTALYPNDLPQAWQLTWYANVAMAVVLPPSRWLLVEASMVAEWCAQVQDNFWFYLYCDEPAQCGKAMWVAEQFPQKFAGIVLAEGVTCDVDHSAVAILRVGQEVCWYDAPNLRYGREKIVNWLAQLQGNHVLVLVAPDVAQEVISVQTLLTLLGE